MVYYNLISPIDSIINYEFETEKIKGCFMPDNKLKIIIKNTDLTFVIDYYINSINIDYNSLKVLKFIEDYQDSILSYVTLEKSDLKNINIIKEKLGTKKVKKKSLFSIFNR